MKKVLCIVLSLSVLFCLSVDTTEAVGSKWTKLVETSGDVLSEIQHMPDQSVPEDLMKKCAAIAIFPNTISAGLGIGGKYGQGIIMVRKKRGKWSPPAIFTIAGGSIGFQIGGQASDIVLLIMTERSVEGILKGKFKLGADAAVAAGPVGRDAQAATDAHLGGILSYSRSRGLFAGIKLEGDVITEHWEGNEELYGKKLSAEEILIENKAKMPKSANGVLGMLKKYK
ncbi:MAG: lipid-binding SYLF domain-containing protein [Candidatus Omnitrophota bacterium]